MKPEVLLCLLNLLAFSFCIKSIQDAFNTKIPLNEEQIQKLGLTYDPNDVRDLIRKSGSLQFLGSDPTDDCKLREDYSGPDFLQFYPSLKGIVKKVGDSITFVNTCFRRNQITLTKIGKDSITFSLTALDPASLFCKDSYIFTTSRIHHIKLVLMRGDREFSIARLSHEDFEEIAVGGVRVFSFCLDLPQTIASIYNTYKMMTTDPRTKKEDIIEEVELKNIDFLKRFANYTLVDRGKWADVPLPIEDEIQSGDFIGLAQVYDWDSMMILYFSGSRITHSSMALRLEGQLYVIDSAYEGVAITPYKEFIRQEMETVHSIIHMPLREEYRKKFNVTKAYEYFKTVEGIPYGFKNFLFAGMDVPHGNFPTYMASESLLLILSLVEKFDRKTTDKFAGEGLNIRLGTKGLSIPEIALAAARKGMTFEELMSIPEENDWLYSDGNNLICSTLVVEMYRHAGIFEDLKIYGKEFSPKDITNLDIFDKNYNRPKICVEADPMLPYCHIVGKFRIQVDDYSTVTPYDNMNTKCPTTPPSYFRPNGC